ncbi:MULTISPECIES: acyl carrier protein [Kitasatospora]|uniref:Acyl carrier protein n=1 Tax=Kitasatospora cathayae TaxID=3004092 RepID=A0ABY7Q4Y6_9ACTN|nr:acyl carrier protein [Kitasatospora sp. HUAS 3-15]WBP87686.1 acyl carrier protein [Kitasatospora sp. HUAS 3-15]
MSAVAIDETKVREIVADCLDLEIDELTLTDHFIDHYGADSLNAIEVLARLEKQFNVTIPQDELANMVNLAAVLEVLSRATAR